MHAPESETSPDRPPRWLAAARFLGAFYAVSLLGLYLASLPAFIERVTTGAVPDIVFDVAQPVGNAYFATRAAAAGLSLQQYVLANILASLLVLIVHTLVAALIFWRLPRSGFGLLSATVIFLIGTSAAEDAVQVAGLAGAASRGLALFMNLGALVWPLFPIWLYLFPDGRAVPRWARWPIGLAMAAFAGFMVAALLDAAGLLSPTIWQSVVDLNARVSFVFILVLPGLVLALASQVYRYWRVSGPAERQQTKWFLFGLALFVAIFPLSELPFMQRIDAISGSLTLMIFPITLGIALLRYRLWDVDVVVRRTVGYGILTVLLLLVYFGTVVVLQRVFTELTGQGSTLATILSTLLIAVLFLPLRRRIQDWIDRRFYRRKYDAAKVLEGFAATARDETDLDQLTAELARVIQETMQPESVSVWLQPVPKRPVGASSQELAPVHRRSEVA